MYFRSERTGIYYDSIDIMCDNHLLMYCIDPDIKPDGINKDDVKKIFELGYVLPLALWIDDYSPILLNAGLKAQKNYKRAMPLCQCMKKSLQRRWRSGENNGSYIYICPECGREYDELQYGSYDKDGIYNDVGICICLGTAEEQRAIERGGVDTQAQQTVANAAALALAEADDVQPIIKKSSKYKMMLCPTCWKDGMLLRAADDGQEWFCTLCGVTCFADENGFMGVEKPKPAAPSL